MKGDQKLIYTSTYIVIEGDSMSYIAMTKIKDRLIREHNGIVDLLTLNRLIAEETNVGDVHQLKRHAKSMGALGFIKFRSDGKFVVPGCPADDEKAVDGE